MVATSHALSTQMGVDVLSRGGNAVDAYVAAVLTADETPDETPDLNTEGNTDEKADDPAEVAS